MPLNKETEVVTMLINMRQGDNPTASLQRGKTSPNEYPGYDTKQSNVEFSVMLELWGMRNTP